MDLLFAREWLAGESILQGIKPPFAWRGLAYLEADRAFARWPTHARSRMNGAPGMNGAPAVAVSRRLFFGIHSTQLTTGSEAVLFRFGAFSDYVMFLRRADRAFARWPTHARSRM